MQDTPRFTLGTLLYVLGIALLSVLILWYILFQARNFLSGPVITLDRTYETIQRERVVTISGVARNIVKLTLNGRELTTDKEGVFREGLVLESGYTLMTLEAFDRFGRSTSLAHEFVFIPNP